MTEKQLLQNRIDVINYITSLSSYMFDIIPASKFDRIRRSIDEFITYEDYGRIIPYLEENESLFFPEYIKEYNNLYDRLKQFFILLDKNSKYHTITSKDIIIHIEEPSYINLVPLKLDEVDDQEYIIFLDSHIADERFCLTSGSKYEFYHFKSDMLDLNASSDKTDYSLNQTPIVGYVKITFEEKDDIIIPRIKIHADKDRTYNKDITITYAPKFSSMRA
jgi:hypothetical protein